MKEIKVGKVYSNDKDLLFIQSMYPRKVLVRPFFIHKGDYICGDVWETTRKWIRENGYSKEFNQ